MKRKVIAKSNFSNRSDYCLYVTLYLCNYILFNFKNFFSETEGQPLLINFGGTTSTSRATLATTTSCEVSIGSNEYSWSVGMKKKTEEPAMTSFHDRTLSIDLCIDIEKLRGNFLQLARFLEIKVIAR